MTQCGESFSYLECCDASTNTVGPACCGSVPYSPTTQTCCDDLSIVESEEANENNCIAPSVEPTSAPSESPSELPSDHPSELLSNKPSAPPTEHPSDLPTQQLDDCVGAQLCGYVLADDGTIKEGRSAVCIRTNEAKGLYKSKCLANDELLDQIPGSGFTSLGLPIVSCGCCDEATLPPGSTIENADKKNYCINDNPCPAEEGNICETEIGDKVRVNICKVDKNGNLQDVCQKPWWQPQGDGKSVYGCGLCPTV